MECCFAVMGSGEDKGEGVCHCLRGLRVEGLMTVTPVVQFVFCHATWLSTLILITVYLITKVGMK